MKKFYIMLAALSVTASMAAQQLPNAGFEDAWATCYPWSSDTNPNGPYEGSKSKGSTPKPWCIANVYAMGGFGAAQVGSEAEGHNGGKAVKLTNQTVYGQQIPGYMSLGTTWNTSALKGFSPDPATKDGGSFGGIEFTFRPDALSFYYKRENGGENPASVVAYTWKGSWTQADVPGTVAGSNPKTTTMIDRDRNILGMKTTTGGKVTPSEDAKLISKINTTFTGDKAEWTLMEVPFEYEGEEAPEKINVAFAAGEYFSINVPKNLSLTVDDVKLVYYSRLSGLQFKNADIPGFDPDTFEYKLDEVMPDNDTDIKATTLGNSGVAEAAIELDHQNSLAKITVTNAHGNDADDKNSHVYTVKFLPAVSSINDVIDMTSADVRYVDLYGNAVAADALVNGQTYIKLVNGKATKVIANN